MQDISLKESTDHDSEFFIELFGEIKNSELHLGMWPEPIKSQMIMMQYYAFMQTMKTEFPDHKDYLICFQSKKAGRLQLEKDVKGFRIMNISLLSSFRNKGIGTTIINGLIDDANQKKIPIFLDVDLVNPAFHLYQRLGFEIIQQNEIRYSMKYLPK